MKKNNNIFNLEKKIKANLKKKISYTKELLIRFLMTGVIILSVSLPLKADYLEIFNGQVNTTNRRGSLYSVNLAFKNTSNADTASVGEGSIGIGYDASARGASAIGIGISSSASGQSSIAIGDHANSESSNGISIGNRSFSKVDAIAIGKNSQATQDRTIAIGIDSKSGSPDDIAIGNNATTPYINNADILKYSSIAIGKNSTAQYWSTVLGQNARAIQAGVAIGLYSNANKEQAVALGHNAFANRQAVALGSDVFATGESSIAIGNDDISKIYKDKLDDNLINKIYDNLIANKEGEFNGRTGFNATYTGSKKIYSPTFAKGIGAIAIGSRTVAAGDGSTSIGTLSFALADRSTTLGLRSYVSQDAIGATAIGEESRVFAPNSLAVGNRTEATNQGALAYGYNSYAVGKGSIAIGANVAANAQFENTDTNGANKNSTNIIKFYDTLTSKTSANDLSNNPLLNDNYDVLNEFDKSMNDFISQFDGGLPIRESNTVEITTTKDIKKKISSGENAIVIGNNSYAVKKNSLSLGYGTLADADNSFALGSYSYVKASSINSIALGVGTTVDGRNSFVAGTSSSTKSKNTIVLGAGSSIGSSSDNSAAIGLGVKITGSNSFIAGNESSTISNNTIILGTSSKIEGGSKNSIVIGNSSNISSNLKNVLILGNNSKVSDTTSDKSGNKGNVAILGNDATATITNSVVLGNNSTTNYKYVKGQNDSSVSGTLNAQNLEPYRPSNSSYGIKPDPDAGVVSVAGWEKADGSLGQRRIINVAAGALDSDVATVGQLRSLESTRKDDNMVYVLETNGTKKVVKQVGDKFYHVDPKTGFALNGVNGSAIQELTDAEVKMLKIAPRGNATDFASLGSPVTISNSGKGKIENNSTEVINGNQLYDLVNTVIGTSDKISSDKLSFLTPSFNNLKQTGGDLSTGTTFKSATDALITVLNKGIKLNTDANIEKQIYLGDTISIISESWGSGADRYSKDNIATLTTANSNNIYIGIKENPTFKTVKLSQAQSNPADLDLITRKYLDDKGLKFVTDKLNTESNEYKTNTTNNTVTILGGGSNGLQSINDTTGKTFETKNIRTYLNNDNKIYVTLADKPVFDSVTITKDQTAADKTPIDQELISKKYLDKQLQNVSGTLKYSDGTVTNKSIDLKTGTLTIKGTNGKVTTTANDSGEIVIGLDSSIADKTYVDNKVDGLSTTLNFKGDNTNATGSVNLKTGELKIKGTSNQIMTSSNGDTLTISLDNKVLTDIESKINKDLTGLTEKGKNLVAALVTVVKDSNSSDALEIKSDKNFAGGKDYKVSLNETTLLNNLKTDEISSTTPNTNEKLATGTAVKNYVDSKIQNISTNLTFTGNEGGDKSINLLTDKLSINGKTDEIKTTSKDGGILEIGLSDTIKNTINSKIDKNLTDLTENGGNVVKSKAMEAIDVKSTTDALQVSIDTNTANKKTFNLSLDTNKLKELAGVDKLDTIYAKIDASNITDPNNQAKWRTALDVYTKGETNTEINKAKEVVEGVTNEIDVTSTPQNGSGNKYTVSLSSTVKDKISSIDNKADKTDLTELSNKSLGFVTDAKDANATEISKKLGEKLEILGGIVNPTGTQRLVSFNDTDGKTYETKNIRTYTNNDGKLYITLANTPEFQTVNILKDQTSNDKNTGKPVVVEDQELISKKYLESRLDGNVEIANTSDAVSGAKIYDAIKGAKPVVNNGSDKYITVSGTKQDNINSDTYSIGFNKDKLVEDVRETSITGAGTNDKLTTSKAVVDYINSKITNITTSLKYDGDNSSEKTIDLATGKLTLDGKSGEITTESKDGGIIEIGLDTAFKTKVDGKADKTYVDNTFVTNADYSNTVLNIQGDNSTKGNVNLKTGTLNVLGTSNEIDTKVENSNITISISKAIKDDIASRATKDLNNLTDDGKNKVKDLAIEAVEVVLDSSKNPKSVLELTPTTENNKKTYTLGLNEEKLKEIVGTTTLSSDYAKVDASNITDDENKNKWRTTLDVYTKDETNTEINKAKEVVEGTADEIVVKSTQENGKGTKYTVSLDPTLKAKLDKLPTDTKSELDKKVDKTDFNNLKDSTLTFESNSGTVSKKLGETLKLVGDNNLSTKVESGEIHIQLKDAPTFEKVTLTAEQSDKTKVEDKDLITKKYFESNQHIYEVVKGTGSSSALDVESSKSDVDNKTTFTVKLNETQLFNNLKSETITGNANKLSTDKAVKDYVDGKIDNYSTTLTYTGNDTTTSKSIDLKTQKLTIQGKDKELNAVANDNGVIEIGITKELNDKIVDLNSLTAEGKKVVKDLSKEAVTVEVDSTKNGNGALSVVKTENDNNNKYTLSLDEDKLKDLVGTTNLSTEYAKLDASNVTSEENKGKWRIALDVYSKSETNTEINKAKEKVTAGTGIKVQENSTDTTKGTNYTVSLTDEYNSKILDVDNKANKTFDNITDDAKKVITDLVNIETGKEVNNPLKVSSEINADKSKTLKVTLDESQLVNNIKTDSISATDTTNDNKLTTSKAVKDYVDTLTLNYTANEGGDKNINLKTQKLTIQGKADELKAVAKDDGIIEIGITETLEKKIVDLNSLSETGKKNVKDLAKEAVTVVVDGQNNGNGALSISDSTTGNDKTYTLSLDEAKLKALVGTTNLATEYAKVDSSNITTDENKEKWRTTLDVYSKSEADAEINKAKEEVVGTNGEIVVTTATQNGKGNKYTISLDSTIKSKIDNLPTNTQEELDKKATKEEFDEFSKKTITFKTNSKSDGSDDISKKLGEFIEILGGSKDSNEKYIENGKDFVTDNLRTYTNNGKLYITMSNSPIFNSITVLNDPKADTDATNKKYVDAGLALKLDKSDIVNQMITYKVNGKDSKETKLSTGFDFSNGKNIEAAIEDNGVVKFNLKDELTSIKKISGGENNKSNISFEDNGIVLENDNAKLNIVKDGNENTIKVTGLTDRNIDSENYGEIGRAATENAVKDIALKLGLLKPTVVEPSVGPAGNDGLDGKSIVEKVEAIRDGLSGNIVYTTETGERLVKENGKYYKLKEDGTKEEIAEDKVVLSLVDASGQTTNSILLRNISSALGADTSTSSLTSEKAKELVENLLKMSGDDLNKASNLSDLQALAQSGLDFTTNKKDGIEHRTLGSSIAIIGKEAELENYDNYSSDNLITNIIDNKIQISMLKTPTFDNVYLTSTKGNIEDENYAKGDNGNLAVRRSEVKDLIEKGIKVKTEDDKEFTVKIGGTLEIVGEKNTSTTNGKVEKNKSTTVSEETEIVGSGNVVSSIEDNKVVVRLTDNPEFESVKVKDVEIKAEENKIVLNGKDGKAVTLSNIEAGKEEKDAVNYGQFKVLSDNVVKYDNENKTSITLGTPDNKNGVRIQNVADGINEKDAVNKGQLDRVSQENISGIASSMAMATIPQVIDRSKPYTIGAATAIYKGEGAVALGVSGVNQSGNLIFKASSSINSKLDLGASVGISYAFGESLIQGQSESVAINGDLIGYINNMEKDLNELKDYKEDSQRKIAELEEKLLKLLDQKENGNENKVVSNDKNYPDIMKCIIEDGRCIVGDFETDKTKIINKEEIKELVRVLNENVESGVIDVVGHTDSVGKFDYNIDLGLQRATEVVNLLKAYGLKKEIVFRNVTSSGKIVPVTGNKTTTQKAENRRVEIHFDNMKYVK